MNGRGHRLTAIAFGLSICSAYASGTIELDYPAEPLIVLAVFMAGIIAGSSAPDWLELPIIIGYLQNRVGNRLFSAQIQFNRIALVGWIHKNLITSKTMPLVGLVHLIALFRCMVEHDR